MSYDECQMVGSRRVHENTKSPKPKVSGTVPSANLSIPLYPYMEVALKYHSRAKAGQTFPSPAHEKKVCKKVVDTHRKQKRRKSLHLTRSLAAASHLRKWNAHLGPWKVGPTFPDPGLREKLQAPWVTGSHWLHWDSQIAMAKVIKMQFLLWGFG